MSVKESYQRCGGFVIFSGSENTLRCRAGVFAAARLLQTNPKLDVAPGSCALFLEVL